jgi:hypothetical protein
MKKVIKNDLFPLFLVIVFPIHTWSIYLVFYNFEWLAKRTIPWDAVGYSAYSLCFALLESLIIFIVATPLFLLLRKKHGYLTAKAIAGVIFFIVVTWMIIYQINKNNGYFIQTSIENIVIIYNLRYRYKIILVLLAAGIIALTISVPPLLVLRSNKLISISLDLQQRLELVSYLYLLIDVIAIGIVVTRNLLTITT